MVHCIFNFFFLSVGSNPASKNRAFCLERGMDSLEKWKKIPAGVDIVMSHGPPYGIGDRVVAGLRVGCKDLLKEIQTRICPMYHVYGHIHEGGHLRQPHLQYDDAITVKASNFGSLGNVGPFFPKVRSFFG
jgi:Icc-related predicted phosphoesterase